MKPEEALVRFVHETQYADLPPEVVEVVRRQLLRTVGTTVAGAQADGCATAVRMHRAFGGQPEATALLYGGRLPAQDAAFVNAVMARALDFCDALPVGPHPGSAVIPAALAAAELAGGCSGQDFLAAVAVGTEVTARLNLSERAYDGFDPTGICVPFGAAAAAARLLKLDAGQTANALGLALNSCGGSFQSHIDGTLGVRFVEGAVARSGVLNARLASHGVTGPRNFLAGIYGYFHLYGDDLFDPAASVSQLGSRYELLKVLFKKYPSCALSASSTEVTLQLLAQQDIAPEDIERVEVTVTPYTHRLVGHPFEIGSNPSVNAQFSIQYCVANALLRKSSKIHHFDEVSIQDPQIARLFPRIQVSADAALEARGRTAVDLTVRLRSGRSCSRQLDIAPGYPGRPLAPEEHAQRFADCIAYADGLLAQAQVEQLTAVLQQPQELADIRELLPLLVSPRLAQPG